MLTAISAIFVFLMVIVVHEFGHFIVAKSVGIRVNEFAIGMGPKLFQRKKGETEYTFRAFPIGGYVKMEGEDEASNDPRSFGNVPVLSRIAVVVAGAIMNFVLAIIILSIVTYGIGTPINTISETIENSPASKVIQPGDTIIAINDINIKTWDDIVENINSADPSKEMIITVDRNGSEIDLLLTPEVTDGKATVGIVPAYAKTLKGSIKGGFEKTGEFIVLMFDFIKMIFRGEVGLNHLSGPVGVIKEVGNAAEMGIYNLLYILGFISVNLGFFNLLPIPALDGSRVVFLIIELFRGKPIDPNKEGFVHFIGFVLLISLMLVVTFKDIVGLNIF